MGASSYKTPRVPDPSPKPGAQLPWCQHSGPQAPVPGLGMVEIFLKFQELLQKEGMEGVFKIQKHLL